MSTDKTTTSTTTTESEITTSESKENQKDLNQKQIKISWTKFDLTGQDVPLSRSSHSISCIGNKVFLFGGDNVPRVPLNSDVNVFDLEKSKWSKIKVTKGEAPEPRVAHAQAVINDKLWIFGGRLGIVMDEGPLNDMYCFDVNKGIWTGPIKSNNEPPAARSYHRMVSVDNKLYVFGGCGVKGRLNDLHVYDTIEHIWKKLPTSTAITGRGGPSLAVSADKKKLYIVAGFSGQENNDVHIFNLESEKWTHVEKASTFRARSVCGTCTLGNYVTLSGGEVNTSERGHEGAGDFISDVLFIDSNSATVCSTTLIGKDQPPARGWTSMCAVNDCSAILFGGLAGNDKNPIRLNDL